MREIGMTGMSRMTTEFVDRAQSRVSRRTGNTAASIHATDPVDLGNAIEARILVDEESGKYQDEGTGIYGPEGQPIQGNPLLAFDWPAAGGLVIVHSVKGSPGTHFWTRTVEDWPDIVRAAGA